MAVLNDGGAWPRRREKDLGLSRNFLSIFKQDASIVTVGKGQLEGLSIFPS